MKATDIETKQQTIYMCDNIRQGAIMLQWKGQKHALSPDDVAYILLFKHIKNQTRYALLIGQEIGRESGKIIRPCIRVALAPRSVELQDDNCAAPSFRSGTGCDVIDSTVNGCATRQRSWGVPQMKGKSERLSI